MATEQRIRQLFDRYLSGQCSSDEVEQLYDYFGLDVNNGLLTDHIAHTLERTDEAPRAMQYLAKQIADRVGVRLLDNLGTEQSDAPRNIRRFSKWLPYASAIALALVIGFYLLNIRQQPTDIGIAAATIEPGGNRATLTLADGRTIDLSEEQSGVVVGEGITYLDGSVVVENRELGSENDRFSEEDGIRDSQLSLFNAISTPKGGTYQITLPDGSNVWLNAASILKYPSRFDDDKRVVEMSGEGYFAIARDARRPFIVKAVGQVVEVLGTEFNIAAYHDESATRTTLVKGSVSVKSILSPQRHLKLKSGEQSVLSAEGTLNKVQADIYAATAWRDGRFALTNVPFDAFMRQLARWYNIDILYQGDVPNIGFKGEITRDVTLANVLKFLKNSGVHFEITNDRKLIVKEEKQ